MCVCNDRNIGMPYALAYGFIFFDAILFLSKKNDCKKTYHNNNVQ